MHNPIKGDSLCSAGRTSRITSCLHGEFCFNNKITRNKPNRKCRLNELHKSIWQYFTLCRPSLPNLPLAPKLCTRLWLIYPKKLTTTHRPAIVSSNLTQHIYFSINYSRTSLRYLPIQTRSYENLWGSTYHHLLILILALPRPCKLQHLNILYLWESHQRLLTTLFLVDGSAFVSLLHAIARRVSYRTKSSTLQTIDFRCVLCIVELGQHHL